MQKKYASVNSPGLDDKRQTEAEQPEHSSPKAGTRDLSRLMLRTFEPTSSTTAQSAMRELGCSLDGLHFTVKVCYNSACKSL